MINRKNKQKRIHDSIYLTKKPLIKESFKFEKAIEGEPKRRCPDLKNTYKKLEWRPKIELNKGIDLTIKYFKESYFS